MVNVKITFTNHKALHIPPNVKITSTNQKALHTLPARVAIYGEKETTYFSKTSR